MHTIIGLFAVFAVMVQGPLALERGDWVRVSSRPNSIPVRIVAVSGDRVRIENSVLYLNGVAVQGISPELLRIDSPFEPEIIPLGQYFVIGQTRIKSATGRTSVMGFSGLFSAAVLEKLP